MDSPTAIAAAVSVKKRPRRPRPTRLVGVLTGLIAVTLIGAVYLPLSRTIGFGSQTKAPSCLRSIGLAALLYVQQAPAATQPTLPTTHASDEAALWSRLRAGGCVVLMRHAATPPGSGEPPNFDLNDPTTQRNLSDTGREQARRVGAAFRRENVAVGRVLSSQYFRCRETALLAFGSGTADPLLNALPEDPVRAKEQAADLRWLSAQKPATGNAVLVTHQANIVALAGIKPEPGECVLLSPAGDGVFWVIGRLRAGDAKRP